MTARERAALRDKVARARLTPPSRARVTNLRGWTPQRLEAAEAAKEALHRAIEKRHQRDPIPVRERCVYCGVGVRPRRRPEWIPATCVDHRDLPAVDPFYLRMAA